jgi:hypothetical protein
MTFYFEVLIKTVSVISITEIVRGVPLLFVFRSFVALDVFRPDMVCTAEVPPKWMISVAPNVGKLSCRDQSWLSAMTKLV